jgi:hypothetical protein
VEAGYEVEHPAFGVMSSPRLTAKKEGVAVRLDQNGAYWEASSGYRGGDDYAGKKFTRLTDAVEKIGFVFSSVKHKRNYKTSLDEGILKNAQEIAAELPFAVRVEVKDEYHRDPYNKKTTTFKIAHLVSDEFGVSFTGYKSNGTVCLTMEGRLSTDPEKMHEILKVIGKGSVRK